MPWYRAAEMDRSYKGWAQRLKESRAPTELRHCLPFPPFIPRLAHQKSLSNIPTYALAMLSDLDLFTKALLAIQALFLASCAWIGGKQHKLIEFDTSYKPSIVHRSLGMIERWSAVEPLAEVSLWFQQTKHYQFSIVGELESEFLLPPSGHIVSITTPQGSENYTIGMFHQLRCLKIMRSDITHLRKTEHIDHCLRYLWQSVLCSANTQLEGVFIPRNLSNVAPIPRDYRCRNWQALYDAAMVENPG